MEKWKKSTFLCLFFLLSGGFEEHPSASFQSRLSGAGVSRAEPHLPAFQPPLRRERERAGARLGGRSEYEDGAIFLSVLFVCAER